MKSGSSCSSKLRFGLLVGLLAIVASGCSMEPVARHFKETKYEFGPQRTDGDLPVGEIGMNSLPTPSSIRWEGEVDTAAWYRTADDLGWLSRKLDVQALGKLSFHMREAVAKSTAIWTHNVGHSAYASAAVGETREDTNVAISEGSEMLRAQEPLITKVLADRNAKTPWPTENISLVDLVGRVDKFLVEFVQDVEASEVDPRVKSQLVAELNNNFRPRIHRIRVNVALAYNEEKVYDFVAKVRAAIKAEEVDLGPEINEQLDLAERLPREAEKIRTAKNALSVLIDFWLASTPETRDSEFKPVSPELYDFFKDQSVSDLNCLKRGCGLFTVLKREIFILPQIEEYGVRKLRKKLVEAATTSIKSELENQAVLFLPKLHIEVGAKIVEEIRRQRENIQKISEDYGTYLRVALSRMALAKLGLRQKDTFSGVEPNRIYVNMAFADSRAEPGRVIVAPAGVQNEGAFIAGASSIGAGISVALEQHDYHAARELEIAGLNPIRIQQMQARLLFEQLNKVLMVGGFKTESSRPFEALAMTVDRDRSARMRFNLRDLMNSPLSFAVPDRLDFSMPMRPELVVATEPPEKIKVGVGGQADLLRGLSRLAMRLKDWESTTFDKSLGEIVLADFIPDMPRESVDRKLFPKDLFFAATIGNASVILQNITKKSSAVGLIGLQKKIRWVGDTTAKIDEELKADLSPAQQETMAAIFDLVDGERSTETKVAEVARFVSALTEFLKATKGIEKTRSPILRKPDENGVSPIDQFAGGMEDVKLLIMAMANFLSKESRGKDGLVHPIYSRSRANVALGPSGEPRLLEQSLVIRALMDASEAISAKIYRDEALDILAATNSKFFRTERAFYSNLSTADDSPTLEAAVSMLIAGERLKPFMTEPRVAQWTRMANPWVGAMRDAAESLP